MYLFIFLRFYLFISRERGREEEREEEKQQCVAACSTLPTGDPACNPGTCPNWESNEQLFGLQSGTECTETHQPGLKLYLKYTFIQVLIAVSGRIGLQTKIVLIASQEKNKKEKGLI